MKKQIPFGQPYIDEKDKQAVLMPFESNWILNGPKVREFEEKFTTYSGSKYACAVNSCTAGMHMALVALGVDEGDEVIMPAFSFAANGLSVLQIKAIPKFVDVDPDTYNIDAAKIEAAISKKTKAILVLHYAGLSAEMDEILNIARKYDLAVIEDAAHALGGKYKDRMIGSFGDATVFSFGPLKMITTTGMGGMVTTNSKETDAKIRKLISYGMGKSMWDRKDDKKPWQYTVADLGHNFRMTDVAASMGISQLEKIDWILSRRRELVEEYNKHFAEIEGIKIHKVKSHLMHSNLYYVLRIDSSRFGKTRNDLARKLLNHNIGVSVHWDPPLHQHPLYRKFTTEKDNLIISEKLAREVLSLPLHCKLTHDDLEYICSLF